MRTFNQDLTNGKIYEHRVRNYVVRKYPQAFVVSGNNNGDVFIPELDIFLEVKHDRLVDKTGNFFIECEFRGQESGISNSEAHWWCLCDERNAYVLKTDELRELSEKFNAVSCVIDDEPVVGYLVPAHVIKNHSHIWELPY